MENHLLRCTKKEVGLCFSETEGDETQLQVTQRSEHSLPGSSAIHSHFRWSSIPHLTWVYVLPLCSSGTSHTLPASGTGLDRLTLMSMSQPPGHSGWLRDGHQTPLGPIGPTGSGFYPIESFSIESCIPGNRSDPGKARPLDDPMRGCPVASSVGPSCPH